MRLPIAAPAPAAAAPPLLWRPVHAEAPVEPVSLRGRRLQLASHTQQPLRRVPAPDARAAGGGHQ